jgi:hypothetical protein
LFKYWYVFFIFLMSCDDGSYAFQGIHAQTVRHKNMKFDIRVRGPMIEALRINAMGFPSTRQVRPIALQGHAPGGGLRGCRRHLGRSFGCFGGSRL